MTYSYDVMGRLTQAQTAWPGTASVARTYYGTGAVRTDVENAASPSILVSQAYYYDRAGRRTGYRVGTPGDAVHSDSVAYTYDAPSGELRKLIVWWRTVRFGAIPADTVRFRWDAMGRRDTVAYSSGAAFAFGYDQDGFQRLLCGTHGSNTPGGSDLFQSRVVHDWVDQDGMIRQTNRLTAVPTGCLSTNRLSGLNPIGAYDNRHELTSQAQGATTTSYTYDGSGNRIQTSTTGGTNVTYVDSMAPGHNQLVKRSTMGSNSVWQFRYNPDGSRFDENPCQISCTGPQIGNNPVTFTDPFGLWPELAFTLLPRLQSAASAVGQVVGAVKDFIGNRDDMVDANTIGADKYFHCKGNCEATQRGKVGEFAAEVLSDVRELYGQLKGDPKSDEQADQKANAAGRAGAKASPKQDCNLICAPQRPRGLDEKY